MKYCVVVAFVLLMFVACDDDKERTSLLGEWNCEEVPEQTTPRNYQVGIFRNTLFPNESNQYVINNFYNLGNSEAAEVYFYQDETGKLIIEEQHVMGNSISGSGIVADDFSNIKWEYSVSGLIVERVVATYY